MIASTLNVYLFLCPLDVNYLDESIHTMTKTEILTHTIQIERRICKVNSNNRTGKHIHIHNALALEWNTVQTY